jgi:hypothetical protein
MIYTQGKGIVALGPELKALLAFADPDGHIDIVVHDGKMTVHASVSGHSVFHVVDGWNGGAPVTDDLAWQIDSKAIARQSKSCGTNEEVFFPVSKSGHISRARIRKVDDEGILQDSSLDGHVAHQNVIPTTLAPETDSLATAAGALWLPVSVYSRLKTVAGATSAAIARYCIPSDETKRTRIEFDTTKRFRDEEPARWVVMLAASNPNSEKEETSKPSVENRQEALFDEDEDAAEEDTDETEHVDLSEEEEGPASPVEQAAKTLDATLKKLGKKSKASSKSKIVPKPASKKAKSAKPGKGSKP